MSRRLARRGGAGDDSQTATPGPSSARQATELRTVSYEAPSFPLNEQARAQLGDLKRSRNTLIYKNHIRDSHRALGHSVYDLNDRLQIERQRLNQIRNRRIERGIESSEEDRLAAHVERFERLVEKLNKQSEVAVRNGIDRRNQLEDEGSIMEELYNAAVESRHTTQTRPTRRTRRIQDDDEDESQAENPDQDETEADVDAPPPPSTLHQLQTEREGKHDAWTSTSLYERYAVDNEYAAFKKLWHSGLCGEDGPPLPDANKWFRSDGTPVVGISLLDDPANDDGSDEDIAVAREVISLTCPLSLRPLEEPYSNRKCKHTFEKSAILDYLNGARGAQQCPQTGCSETFKRSDFEKDFFLDPVILRKVQRAKQANDFGDMDVDFDDDMGDESVVAGPSRSTGRVKKELVDRSRRGTMEA